MRLVFNLTTDQFITTPIIIMKALAFSAIIMATALTACNNNNTNEPPVTNLPINQCFIPTQQWIDKSDTELRRVCDQLNGKLFVVNSADELPVDIFGFPDSYTKADYSNSTILIYYHLHRWEMQSYFYSFYRDNVENRDLVWQIRNNVGGTLTPYPDKRQFTRYAIAVNKIPAGQKVVAGVSLSMAWPWDDDDISEWGD